MVTATSNVIPFIKKKIILFINCVIQDIFKSYLHSLLNLMFNISKFLSLFVYFNLSSYGLDDEKYDNEHLQASTADLEQVVNKV